MTFHFYNVLLFVQLLWLFYWLGAMIWVVTLSTAEYLVYGTIHRSISAHLVLLATVLHIADRKERREYLYRWAFFIFFGIAAVDVSVILEVAIHTSRTLNPTAWRVILAGGSWALGLAVLALAWYAWLLIEEFSAKTKLRLGVNVSHYHSSHDHWSASRRHP